ncbi:MAG: ion channel, partial [Steroidobacteraceae bacterium]
MSSPSRRHHARVRPRDGSDRRFVTYGLRRRLWQDLYHLFMTVSWPRLFATFAGFFFLFNVVFAAVYSLQPGDIANLNPDGYWGRFFFSVETLATVGYGDMHPQTPFAHIVAAIEIFIGLMSLALITGMMFARFSRPKARFMFSRYAVIRPLNGQLTLMLRAANARQNIVMEAAAQLRLLRDEVTVEGFRLRRIQDLKLVRDRHPVFLFGWSLLHVIDEHSPLAGASAESLEAQRAYLLLTVIGSDETTGQSLMARQEYPASMLRWNYRFADILTTEGEVDHFDYTRFNDIDPLD